MVEWIREIHVIATEKTVGAGDGGVNKDDVFFDVFRYILSSDDPRIE